MTDPVILDDYAPDEPLCVRCGVYNAERPDRDGAPVCKGCRWHDHVKTPGTTICPVCVQGSHRETAGSGVVEYIDIPEGTGRNFGDVFGPTNPDGRTTS